MGKASSSKKVARAARAAGRPGAGRQWGWPLAISGVVVLGVLLIVMSRGRGEDSEPPLLGDHWHAAYGVYGCDEFLTTFGESMSVQPNLHSHQDNLIHIEPISTAYTGAKANLGGFLEGVGVDLSDTDYDSDVADFTEGDTECAGEPGVLQLMAWDSPVDPEGTLVTEDLAAFRLADGQLLTLAFVPEGAEIPQPPPEAIAALGEQSGVVPPPVSTPTAPVDPATGSSSTVPGETATTLPGEPATPDTSAPTTDSTAPPDPTATTAAP